MKTVSFVVNIFMSMNLKDKLKAEKWKPQQLGILEQWSEQK